MAARQQNIRRTWTGIAVAGILGMTLVLSPLAASPSPPPATGLRRVAGREDPATLRTPVSLRDLRAIERRAQEVVKDSRPAVVAVRVGRTFGSGVIVSKDGLVLTAGHVSGSEAGRTTRVRLATGKEVRGITLGADQGLDIGMIRITEKGEYPFLDMARSAELDAGNWCVALGHPGGYQRGRPPVVRLGRVVQSRSRMIRTDCALIGGDSGGPLLDMAGRVIGIHSRIRPDVSSNYHVPVDLYKDNWVLLERAEDGPILGVHVRDADRGCEITDLVEGLPAASSGLKARDIITAIDRQSVQNRADLKRILVDKDAGDQVTLAIRRGAERLTRRVTLVERPKGL